MEKYIIHFEPMEVEAESRQQAEDIYYRKVFNDEEFPTIKKILHAKYNFDVDAVEKIGRMF